MPHSSITGVDGHFMDLGLGRKLGAAKKLDLFGPRIGQTCICKSGHDLPIDSRSSAFLFASSCSKYFGLHCTSGIRSEDSIKLLRWLEFSKNVCHISHTTVLQGDCFVFMFRWLLRRIVVIVFFCVRASNVEENVFSNICHYTSVT
jgi:hypothetical protein